MIVVKIELHSAVTRKVTLLGTMIVDNIGVRGDLADYRVRVGAKRNAGDLPVIAQKPLRTGEVKDYPREKYNVWRLISRAIRSAFPEEK